MAGYTRNDTSNNIATGNIINATDLDGEFDALQSAFVATTGHNHDGTTGSGAPISTLGPTQEVVVITTAIRPSADNTIDLGTSLLEFKDLYIDGTANIDSLVADTADINGGTIDNATIATSDITVGSGKTLNVSAGTLTLADNQISGDKVEGGTINATTITTLTSTTVNATTVNTTNIEATTIKAKDGTTAGTIANTTGVVTITSLVATSADINGGTVDGTTIGASVPAAITGTTITATGDVTIADKIVHTGDTDTAIRFPAADTVTVETSGSERMRILSGGNVGIGTSSPDAPLHLANATSANFILEDSGAATNNAAQGKVEFQRSADVPFGGLYITDGTVDLNISTKFSTGFLTFGTDTGTERMRITSTGNVGIGTISPGYKLDVTGTANVSSDLTVGGAITGSALAAYREKITTVGTVSASTYNIDTNLSNIFDITLGNNVTFTFTNPPSSGFSKPVVIILRQDGTGSRTATFTGAKYTEGQLPTLSTGAGDIDVLSFFTIDGGTSWFGTFAMANVS